MTTDNRTNEPKQSKAKSSQDFVSLDPEKVAEVLEGSHFIEHGPGYGEHITLTPEARIYFSRALCEAYTEGRLT